MSALFLDTQPQAERVQIELLRRAPPWRKLDIVGQLNQTVRTLALSGLRQRYPQATPQELRRRLADLLLGPSLASAVHGVVRATLDVDLVADLRPEHAARFVQTVGDAFYADLDERHIQSANKE
jgi:hypothetical protein